jgi:hypothetical protein
VVVIFGSVGFWVSLFDRALLVYSVVGQIILGQNLVVPDSFGIVGLSLHWI